MVTISPLRRARLADERRPSLADVARAMGIDPAFYLRLESGNRAASAELAESLAVYFGVQVGDIFTPARYTSEPQPADTVA